MTEKEKAKAYDEVIVRAKKLYSNRISEEIFHELKESEDDKIRKEIISILRNTYWTSNKNRFNELVAWIEKQRDKDKLIQDLGEYKVKYTQEVLEKYVNNMSNKDDERLRKTIIAFLKDFAEQGYENAVECIDWLEKQGEQEEPQVYETEDGNIITYSETDGYKFVEPKFHKGQWIVKENFGVYKVIEVCESWYEVVDDKYKHYSISFDDEYMCHLWTIKDAKDGDVLTTNGGVVIFEKIDGLNIKSHCYFYYNGFKPSLYIEDILQNQTAFRPATKEEREILFKIMKEDGYEWSSEKRKLIKIK